MLGVTPEEIRSAFFDLAAGMGAFFHFTFEDYKNMTTSEMLELYSRIEKFKSSRKNKR